MNLSFTSRPTLQTSTGTVSPSAGNIPSELVKPEISSRPFPSPAPRRRGILAASVATLFASLLLGGSAFAQAGGGNGGEGNPDAPGGAGATGYTGAAGGNGSTFNFFQTYGGGGGGGAAGGGLGGLGGAGGISGGNGGTGGLNGATGASITSGATGLNGGSGAAAPGGGGGGGAGGYGYIVTGAGPITNSFVIGGGSGGAGGLSGTYIGGNGGSGGLGVIFTQTGVTFTNSGTITGGNGGAGGSGALPAYNGAGGSGGDGLSAAGITILNSGTIAGGTGNGAGYSLRLSGGTNALTSNGGTLTGGILLSGGTLSLDQKAADGATGSATYSNVISGAGTLSVTTDASKSVTLTGANTYTGATTVNAGTLKVNGSIASSSSVTVAQGAKLTGSGQVSGISGAGTVAPGGGQILTATHVDASAGTSFAFSFTQAGLPTFGNAGASGNDVLHLTDTTPFVLSLTAANTLTLDFSGANLGLGQTYYGGFFTDSTIDPSLVSGATFAYTGLGQGDVIQYEGMVSDTAAGFSTGTVQNGEVMEFQVVATPEPSNSLIGFALAMVVVGWSRLRRQRSAAVEGV